MRRIVVLLVFAIGCAKPAVAAAPKPETAPAKAPEPIETKSDELLDPSEPPPRDCLAFDTTGGETRTLEGVVRKAKIDEPAVGPFTYYYLHLAEPTCMSGDADESTIQDVQIIPDDKGLFPPRGKRVRVTGTYISQFTAWHVTKILIHADAWELAQ